MRTSAIAFCIVLLVSAAADAQEFDHHDPAALVARARVAIAEGDLPTACVLLSRAGTLAPHDARVSLAWGDYEAAQNGTRVPAPAAAQPASAVPAAAAKPAGPIPAEPPPLWRPR